MMSDALTYNTGYPLAAHTYRPGQPPRRLAAHANPASPADILESLLVAFLRRRQAHGDTRLTTLALDLTAAGLRTAGPVATKTAMAYAACPPPLLFRLAAFCLSRPLTFCLSATAAGPIKPAGSGGGQASVNASVAFMSVGLVAAGVESTTQKERERELHGERQIKRRVADLRQAGFLVNNVEQPMLPANSIIAEALTLAGGAYQPSAGPQSQALASAGGAVRQSSVTGMTLLKQPNAAMSATAAAAKVLPALPATAAGHGTGGARSSGSAGGITAPSAQQPPTVAAVARARTSGLEQTRDRRAKFLSEMAVNPLTTAPEANKLMSMMVIGASAAPGAHVAPSPFGNAAVRSAELKCIAEAAEKARVEEEAANDTGYTSLDHKFGTQLPAKADAAPKPLHVQVPLPRFEAGTPRGGAAVLWGCQDAKVTKPGSSPAKMQRSPSKEKLADLAPAVLRPNAARPQPFKKRLQASKPGGEVQMPMPPVEKVPLCLPTVPIASQSMFRPSTVVGGTNTPPPFASRQNSKLFLQQLQAKSDEMAMTRQASLMITLAESSEEGGEGEEGGLASGGSVQSSVTSFADYLKHGSLSSGPTLSGGASVSSEQSGSTRRGASLESLSISMHRPSDHPSPRSSPKRSRAVKSLKVKQDMSFARDEFNLVASGCFHVRQTHLSPRLKGVSNLGSGETSLETLRTTRLHLGGKQHLGGSLTAR